MKFKSKGQTLKNISLNKSKIPKLFLFTVKEYMANKDKIISKISSDFNNIVAIRSSNLSEDRYNSSFAGYFDSYLNIDPHDKIIVKDRIEKVINSYKKYVHPKNEVLIQDMVKNVKLSGVCTTCDTRTFSPYTTIEYKYGTDTSIVTSGKKNIESVRIFNLKKNRINIKDDVIKLILKSKGEIEKISKKNNLEIEFAVDNKNIIYILQIRLIVKPINVTKINYNKFEKTLIDFSKKINYLKYKKIEILGKNNFYGVMPDWNPAEIIGTKPKKLALSLYEELITNKIWAIQRKNYGYRDVSNHKLLKTFLGTPYVDIRLDFNSWIPKNLDKILAEKLINYYLEKLKNNKNLHDKIEFEVVFSNYNFSSEKKIKQALKEKFKKNEIKIFIENLKLINSNTFNQLESDYKKIKTLEKKLNSNYYNRFKHRNRIAILIEDCKEFGTLPFAGLARCSFVAMDIINSMVIEKIITVIQKNDFLQSLNTITNRLSKDINKINKQKFLDRYGHLRPNTYEISSLNYAEGYDDYFGSFNLEKKTKNKRKIFNNKNKSIINDFIKSSNLNIKYEKFISYLKKSIEYREYAKFVFTKSIDKIFNSLIVIGKQNNINRNDLSHLDIDFINFFGKIKSKDNFNKKIKKNIINNINDYNLNKNFILPDTIFETNDIFCYKLNDIKINFITSKQVIGEIHLLDNIKIDQLKGKIVCIEKADPGYDFLFSYEILGLVTKYGGANSHMAIRCNELNIAAGIGVGENNFNRIIKSKIINLDCETMKIDLIK